MNDTASALIGALAAVLTMVLGTLLIGSASPTSVLAAETYDAVDPATPEVLGARAPGRDRVGRPRAAGNAVPAG